MGGDEIGNQVLLLARLFRELLEHRLELVVGAHARLHHVRQRPLFGVFGGDLEIAADVVADQFLDVLGVAHGEVVAQAGADQHLLYPRHCPRLAVEIDQRGVVGTEVLADAGKDARQAAAGGLDLRVLACQAIHVGGRPAEIGNDAGETGGLVADFLDLVQDRLLGAALDDAPFVLGDRAEGAAAKAAAHDVDREADHLESRDLRIAVGRMRPALEGRGENAVHFRRAQGDRRWVEPDVAFAVPLDQRARVAGIRFDMEGARGVRIKHRIGGHLLVRRQADRRPLAVELRHALMQLELDLDHLRAWLCGGRGGRRGRVRG